MRLNFYLQNIYTNEKISTSIHKIKIKIARSVSSWFLETKTSAGQITIDILEVLVYNI